MVWNGVVSPIGSSPLARGLLADLRESCQRTVDHPRSRGVYATAPAVLALVTGSSPLARGLHRRAGAPGLAPGIIPARAGFTPEGLRAILDGGDHPRSRGVYSCGCHGQLPTLGSSPLARGLPQPIELVLGPPGIIPARAGFTSELGTKIGGLGIIPARAGFTQGRVRRGVGGEDHPRSRGVYA